MTKKKGVVLTKTVVDGAETADRRYHLWDSELVGFGLRVEPTGIRTFIAKYRASGGGKNRTPASRDDRSIWHADGRSST